jgi:hypothetical protein
VPETDTPIGRVVPMVGRDCRVGVRSVETSGRYEKLFTIQSGKRYGKVLYYIAICIKAGREGPLASSLRKACD